MWSLGVSRAYEFDTRVVTSTRTMVKKPNAVFEARSTYT